MEIYKSMQYQQAVCPFTEKNPYTFLKTKIKHQHHLINIVQKFGSDDNEYKLFQSIYKNT